MRGRGPLREDENFAVIGCCLAIIGFLLGWLCGRGF